MCVFIVNVSSQITAAHTVHMHSVHMHSVHMHSVHMHTVHTHTVHMHTVHMHNVRAGWPRAPPLPPPPRPGRRTETRGGGHRKPRDGCGVPDLSDSPYKPRHPATVRTVGPRGGTSRRTFCDTASYIRPFIHPLYTSIAVYAPMYTCYTCIYTISAPNTPSVNI